MRSNGVLSKEKFVKLVGVLYLSYCTYTSPVPRDVKYPSNVLVKIIELEITDGKIVTIISEESSL